jgi:hypothetical protein
VTRSSTARHFLRLKRLIITSWVAAFQTLEDRFGREQATALAEYIESQPGADVSRLATKEDLVKFATKEDVQAIKQELTRFATKDELLALELRLVKEMAKTREDMLSRMNWTAIIQVLTTIGALIALSKII